MAQLLNREINTTKSTNAILRNFKDNKIIVLREMEFNYPDFKTLSIFKDLVLDLARTIDSSKILDISIVITNPGESIDIEEAPNRLMLMLENEASFSYDDNRFIPKTGDLIWLNHDIKIDNHSLNKSIVLILDVVEFIL